MTDCCYSENLGEDRQGDVAQTLRLDRLEAVKRTKRWQSVANGPARKVVQPSENRRRGVATACRSERMVRRVSGSSPEEGSAKAPEASNRTLRSGERFGSRLRCDELGRVRVALKAFLARS
jgi:hypothetical protein